MHFCVCEWNHFSAAANAPTALAAEVVRHTSIRVSWTAPTSGAAVTGYHVIYQKEDAQDRVTIRDSVNVGANTTEHTKIVGLTAGHRYNITVHTLSQHLPSPAVVSPTVTLGKTTCLIVIIHSYNLKFIPLSSIHTNRHCDSLPVPHIHHPHLDPARGRDCGQL